MGTQEMVLREQQALAEPIPATSLPHVSLVVDRPAPQGQALLLLPFAANGPEEALGRQIGLLIQRRLLALPGLTVGHGLLVAVSPEGRRYLSLPRTLSAEQARTCGAGWNATAVLYGAITIDPVLRWTINLHDIVRGVPLLEDTLVGEPEDLLDAPASIAHMVAQTLGYDTSDTRYEPWEARETDHLDALCAYVRAADARAQHGITVPGPDAMREALTQALLLDPTFRAPAHLLISDLATLSDSQTALETLLARLRSLGSGSTPVLTQLAILAEERGHTQQAEAFLAAARALSPAEKLTPEQAIEAAFRARQFAEARVRALALLDAQADHPRAHELLGNILTAEGRFAGAAQQWEMALEQQPDQPKLLMRLGTYFAVAGEYQRAYECLCRAAAYDTMTADALYQLGVTAYRLGMVSAGIAALQHAVQLAPGHAHAHALLARCYQRAGDEAKALVHDAHAVALQPTLWPSALALAYSALQNNRPADALTIFVHVVHMRPNLPEALYGLGLALVANAMLAEGISALSLAHQRAPANVQFLCALALAYDQAGDAAATEHALTIAMKLAPHSTAVANCRAALQQATRVFDRSNRSSAW